MRTSKEGSGPVGRAVAQIDVSISHVLVKRINDGKCNLFLERGRLSKITRLFVDERESKTSGIMSRIYRRTSCHLANL